MNSILYRTEIEFIEYYTWWGERVVLCVDDEGNMKSYYPERGQDQRWAISKTNPKLDQITINGVSYPTL